MSSFYLALFVSLPLVLAGAHIPLGGSLSVSLSVGAGGATTTSPASYPTTKQCVRDSCARQVATGLRQYQAPARSSDCAALFKDVTVTPSAVTIAVPSTPSPRISTITFSVSTNYNTEATILFTTTDSTASTTRTALSTSTTTTTQINQATTTTTTTSPTTAAGATVTVAYGKRGEGEAKVPQWACDCPDLARLSSACACAGFQPRTVTASASTIYTTIPLSSTSVSETLVVRTTTVGTTATSTIHAETTATVLTTSVTQTTTTTTSVLTSATTTTAVSTIGAIPSGTVGYCSDGRVVDGLSTGRRGQAAAAVRPFRIEGEFDTIFEGMILSGPQNITTPSGGTHLCDGTQNNANPSPGVTATDGIADAGRLCGFDFDGSYSTAFQDFFITRISTTTQTANQFWGVLDNLAFTTTGGCQHIVSGDQGILWAYDAFNANVFLNASPARVTLRPGESSGFQIFGSDGGGGPTQPVQGASIFGGAITGPNGRVSFTVPLGTPPGVYRYKATKQGAIRSNSVVVIVPA